MQYACVLRLGHIPRLLRTRNHRLHRFDLPHATFRTSHGSSEEAMGSLEEKNEEHGQRRTWPGMTWPGMTEPLMRDKTSSSGLGDASQSQGGHPWHTSESPSNGQLFRKYVYSPRFKTHSTIMPRDTRVQFAQRSDKLEDESQKLATIIRRFTQVEQHQWDRLAVIAAGPSRENTIPRYAAWKSVLKDFNPESPPPVPTSIEETRIVNWIQKCTTLEEMKAHWPKPPQHMGKSHKDSNLALISAAMRYVPDKLDMVFEAALASPYGQPHWYVLEDVVELLASRLRVTGPENKAPAARRLAQMVIKILATHHEGSVQFTQFTIRSILDELEVDAVESWYYELLNAGCKLHPFTDLRFASRMAKSPQTKALSARVLMRLQETELLDINTPAAASVVTTILSFSKDDLAKLDQESATPADLFRDLHGAGLIPNVITYTTIIRGLCHKGDLSTALDVFETMQQHGVQPNEWTYATLLHGCRTCGEWTALADIAIQACHADVRENIVWNEVLHSIYICNLKHFEPGRPKRALLYCMTSFYSRIFDATPVRPFITGRLAEMGEHVGQGQWFPKPLRRLTAEIPALPSQELRSPGPDTLCILLLSIVRCLPLPYDVVVFYSQYRQMLKQGHPVAKLLVEERGSFVHDAVLRSLIKWKGTLRVAVDILRDMTADVAGEPELTGAKAPSLEEGAGSLQKSDEDTHPDIQATTEPRRPPVPHPAPSVYTWTVLVHGFMKGKKPKDAEYIMTLMRSKGVQPNRVTWNTLVAGYARMQMIPETVDAMRRLEADGHEADDWTMRAFSYLRNKAKAIEFMEATVEANKAHKLAADLQHGRQESMLSSLDKRAPDAEDALEQMVGASSEEAYEQQAEDDALDRELEAGLGLTLDTSSDVDLGEALPSDISERMAQEAATRRRHYQRVMRDLAKVGPVEGSRYDTEGWHQLQEQGLDALSNASERPTGGPQIGPQSLAK